MSWSCTTSPPHEELREAIGPHPQRVIALAQPRFSREPRVLSSGAALTPFTLPEAGMRANARGARALGRETLSGSFARELALEPLLEHYDGIEIAAATLRLLEQAARADATSPPSSARRGRSVCRAQAHRTDDAPLHQRRRDGQRATRRSGRGHHQRSAHNERADRQDRHSREPFVSRGRSRCRRGSRREIDGQHRSGTSRRCARRPGSRC